MRIEVEGKYNTRYSFEDWRSSASALGLFRYFKWLENKEVNVAFKYDRKKSYIEYNREEITRERYLEFAEAQFKDEMHHRFIEIIYEGEVKLSEEQEKVVDEKLKANTIMKKIFKGLGHKDREKVLELINENRFEIIENTFKNGMSMYRNYCNPNSMLSDTTKTCRINGYSIDMGKKGKSAGYMQDAGAYVYEDYLEYDFIPFAFTKTYEAFFINNNYSLGELDSSYERLNRVLEEKKSEKNRKIRGALFEFIGESTTFIDYDVEVIKKDRNKDYFETSYIRGTSIEILKKIGRLYKGLTYLIKINEKYYLNIEKEVIDAILNLYKLDSLIEKLLKRGESIYVIAYVNFCIYEELKSDESKERDKKRLRDGETMNDKFNNARDTGLVVKGVMLKRPNGEQKLKSFKNKLISALSFNDFDAFSQILLKLSDYSGIVFSFAYDLFDDFDENKNLAYAFINSLNVSDKKKENSKGEK